MSVLCNVPSLRTLVLTENTLGSSELAEVAPALYYNKSTEVLDIAESLNGMESAVILHSSQQQDNYHT
jgi:hypothetical protein